MLFVHKYGALYLFIRWLEVCCAAGLVFVSRFLLYNGCLAYSAFKFIQFFFKMVAYFRTITALQRHFIHFVATSMRNLHVKILRNHQLHQLPATEEPELAQSVKNI